MHEFLSHRELIFKSLGDMFLTILLLGCKKNYQTEITLFPLKRHFRVSFPVGRVLFPPKAVDKKNCLSAKLHWIPVKGFCRKVKRPRVAALVVLEVPLSLDMEMSILHS